MRTSTRPDTTPSTAFSEPSGVVAMSVTRSPGLTSSAAASPVPSTTPSPPSPERYLPDTTSSGGEGGRGFGTGIHADTQKRHGLGAVGRQAHEVDPRQDRRHRGIARGDRARAPGVRDAVLEGRLLGLADGAPVDDLQVADAADRAFLERLEGLRDEAAGQRERREAEASRPRS